MWYVSKYMPIGNPDLDPEETISYEIGLQGNMHKNLNASVNIFYKDISDLTGTRFIKVDAHEYTSYFNAEYGNVKGLETIFEFNYHILTGKLSYTLSWAHGTSSYAREVFDIYSRDTTYVPASKEYYLDFDQRHRFFIQTIVNLPLQTKIHLFTFMGTGFPYTPPGQEGKTIERNALRFSPRYQIDGVISQRLNIKGVSLSMNIEIINILDKIYQTGVYDPVVVPPRTEFNNYISLTSPYYHPACDLNHDGLIIPYEEYTSFRGLADVVNDDIWVVGQTSSRRARIGVSISF
jgi:outer membrane receptor protein involved in Fe transport